MSTPYIDALARSLEEILERQNEMRRQPKVPWTAISTLEVTAARIRRQLGQALESVADERSEDAPPTEDELRAAILALPDELVPIVERLIQERRALGRPVV